MRTSRDTDSIKRMRPVPHEKAARGPSRAGPLAHCLRGSATSLPTQRMPRCATILPRQDSVPSRAELYSDHSVFRKTDRINGSITIGTYSGPHLPGRIKGDSPQPRRIGRAADTGCTGNRWRPWLIWRAMFAFLRGTVAKKAAQYVELDVGGVGYEVWVPAGVHRRLVEDQTTTLHTYCHIREDAFQIFGFLREEEKALFTMLLGVSGVGPKLAMAVLSGMSVAEFGQAVLANDVAAFTRVNGVGKKTAQRIVLEMKSKLGQDAELSAILGEADEEHEPDRDDVVAALASLGCSLNEAKRAAARARKALGEHASDEELVKAALRSMAKV